MEIEEAKEIIVEEETADQETEDLREDILDPTIEIETILDLIEEEIPKVTNIEMNQEMRNIEMKENLEEEMIIKEIEETIKIDQERDIIEIHQEIDLEDLKMNQRKILIQEVADQTDRNL
jgi:hypothetical protein